MYKIDAKIKAEDGTVSVQTLGYTDTPEWCYKLTSGSPQVVRDRSKATGLIYRGVVYNLPGHDDFEGADEATAAEFDSGVALSEMMAKVQDADQLRADTDFLMAMGGYL